METKSNYQYWTFPYIVRRLGYVILGVIGAAALAFIFGYFVMLIWNWIMPVLFGLTEITFWQSFGIILLARLVFGGFKHGNHRYYEYNDSRYKSWHRRPGHPHRMTSDKYRNWRYYDQFWREEGEKAFNDFIERKKNEVEEDNNSQS
ncbi:hypothetical protein ACFLSA_07110 [Bacteroidota bacterium]